MTALQKVEALLPEMSPGKKAQVAKWVNDDLGYRFPGIEKTPGVCGGSVCIVRTRIPVWLLVEAKQAGASEADLLKSYPSLRAEDLTNAWAYYRANKEEIGREIFENETVEAEWLDLVPLLASGQQHLARKAGQMFSTLCLATLSATCCRWDANNGRKE